MCSDFKMDHNMMWDSQTSTKTTWWPEDSQVSIQATLGLELSGLHTNHHFWPVLNSFQINKYNIGLYSWVISVKCIYLTRMHSSRMRTVRSSSHVYPNVRWAGGSARGVCTRGWQGVCPGGCVSQHALRQTPHCGQNSWHTLVKILPCRNFAADGKNERF